MAKWFKDAKHKEEFLKSKTVKTVVKALKGKLSEDDLKAVVGGLAASAAEDQQFLRKVQVEPLPW
jgi:hypothetical protein